MDPQRVLVFGNGELLNASVADLLSSEDDLDVMGVTDDDAATLKRQIASFQPHVVVLDEVTYLADRTRLLTFLENYPELRVILVSADSNLVLVYQGQQVPITGASDLANTIRGDRASS